MIYSGLAMEKKAYFNYASQKIENAKREIKKFKFLSEAVSNFKNATVSNYKLNYILMIASSEESDFFNNFKPNYHYIQELKDFEEILKFLKHKLNSKKYNKICSDLASFNENNSSVVEEIRSLCYFYKNKKIKEIDYENINYGTHDFHIILEDFQEYNLEQVVLGIGCFQEKIETGYKNAAEKILSELDSNLCIKINILTDKLTENDQNEPTDIEQKILSGYYKLKPVIFQSIGYFSVNSNFGNLEKTLYDVKNIFRYYGEFGKRLNGLLKNKNGTDYLKQITVGDLVSCSIGGVSLRQCNSKFVSIQSSSIWPSYGEKLRKKALIKHIERIIGCKIDKGQLKGKLNPILVFGFNDLLFINYTCPNDPFGYSNYMELKKILGDIFILKKEYKIMGVLVYNEVLSQSQFIFDPNFKSRNDVDETIKKLKTLFGDDCLSGDNIIELSDKERLEYIKKSPLDQYYISKFKDDCISVWTTGNSKLGQFLDIQVLDSINIDFNFGIFTQYGKEWFLKEPDRKIGYVRNSGELFGKNINDSKLKYILKKVGSFYNDNIDNTIDIRGLLNNIDKTVTEDYYFFYNSSVFDELKFFSNINWKCGLKNKDIIGVIEVGQSKINLWPSHNDFNLLVPKSEFILNQSKKGFKDFDEELYISIDPLSKEDVNKLNKSKKEKKTFDDKIKIRISEKFEITRKGKKGFFRVVVNDNINNGKNEKDN
jgi:hypothetical protein